jgi:transposase
MRKGFATLAQLVQERLKTDPHSGHLFVFRSRRGDMLKIIWHCGQGACERAGARALYLAPASRWHRDDLTGATGILPRRNRLEGAAEDLAARARWLSGEERWRRDWHTRNDPDEASIASQEMLALRVRRV